MECRIYNIKTVARNHIFALKYQTHDIFSQRTGNSSKFKTLQIFPGFIHNSDNQFLKLTL